jgi:hypothetical protein
MENASYSIPTRNNSSKRRWLHELFCSLNLGLVAVLIDDQFVPSFFGPTETKLKYGISEHFHGTSRTVSSHAAFYATAIIIAILVFVCVALLSRISSLRKPLWVIMSCSSFLAFPSFGLTEVYLHGFSPPVWLGICLIAELIFITIVGYLYLMRRSPSTLVAIATAGTHLILWSYVGFGIGIFLAPSPRYIFPAVSFLAVLASAPNSDLPILRRFHFFTRLSI